MKHLNSFSALGGGSFPKIFQTFKCPGRLPGRRGGGGVFKLQLYIFISDCIRKNIPREFDLSLIILMQSSPSTGSPQGLS